MNASASTKEISIIRHSIRNRGGDRLILDYCAFLLAQGWRITYWVNEIDTHFVLDPRIKIQRIRWPGPLGTLFTALATAFEGVVIVDLVVMSFAAWFRNRRNLLYLAQDDDSTYYSFPLMRLFIKFIYWTCLSVMKIPTVCVSAALAEKFYKKKRRISAVPNGIDLTVFYHNQESSFLKFKQRRMTIVVYARKDYRKGLDVAAEAVSEFRKIYDKDDWELWLIGEETAAFDPHDMPVKSFGFLGEKDLRDLLSAADIFLSPSRHEGFGLLQLQALACGCVLVATDCLSYVEHDVHALLSPIGDSVSLASNLQRVVADAELRQRLKANARDLAQQYSLEKSCRQFESVIQSYERNSR